jgi:hypothetical protein
MGGGREPNLSLSCSGGYLLSETSGSNKTPAFTPCIILQLQKNTEFGTKRNKANYFEVSLLQFIS